MFLQMYKYYKLFLVVSYYDLLYYDLLGSRYYIFISDYTPRPIKKT